MKHISEDHQGHEMPQDRISDSAANPTRSKAFSGYVAGYRDRHVRGLWRTAHSLLLELLDDVVEKGI